MFPEGLFPSTDGLHLEALHRDNQSITAMLAVATLNASCPLCGEPAMRVHSRYVRTATDLPWARIRVRLQITVRRFFCDTATCSRRIFAARLGQALPTFARRTNRLAKALVAIGRQSNCMKRFRSMLRKMSMELRLRKQASSKVAKGQDPLAGFALTMRCSFYGNFHTFAWVNITSVGLVESSAVTPI